MPRTINKLFVYGTLLKGEEISGYLRDCKLILAPEVPGRLYDTGRGYPAAMFDEYSDDTVAGELYLMESPREKLIELDRLEEVAQGFYERVLLSLGGTDFFSYRAGAAHTAIITDRNQINHGSWRRFSSLAFQDPLGFALNFEASQKKAYKEPVSDQSDGLIYIKGDKPVLVTAPHATAHVRLGKFKRQEFFTGALAVILHSLTGCHVLYSSNLSEIDPNYYEESAFKKRLADIARRFDIRFLIDLHGTGTGRDSDIYPGIGRDKAFLLGGERYFDALQSAAEPYSISIGGQDVFPAAKQMTVTKFSARELRVPSMQLEIVSELRQPGRYPEGFMRLVEL